MRLRQALTLCRCPTMTVIVRKAFGLAFKAMNGSGMGADAIYAWPGAEIGFMDPDVAVNVVRPEATGDEREQLIAELAEATTPYDAAGVLGVDEVIDPAADPPDPGRGPRTASPVARPRRPSVAPSPTGAPARWPLQLNVVGTTGLGSRLLLLVHGYGADEHDLAPLAPYLDPEGLFFTVCPRGPLTVEPFGGASWYDFTDGGADEATFEGALIELDHAVDTACASRGLDRSRSVWMGFSQGGSMVLALALRASSKARPAAVACLSGLPARTGLARLRLVGARPAARLRAARHPRPDAAGRAGPAGGRAAAGAGPAGGVPRVPDAARDPPRVDHRHPGLAADAS